MLNSQLPSKSVLAAMEVAQRNYVLPIIKTACMDSICAAITDLEDNNVALPDWVEDMLTEMEDLVRVATEYVYISRRGRASLGKEGLVLPEIKDFDEFVKNLRTSLDESISSFKTWVDDRKAEGHECLVGDAPCEPEDEPSYLGSWGTVAPYPRIMRDPTGQLL